MKINQSVLMAVAACAALLSGCGGSDSAPPTVTLLTCDDSMKTAFKPDANTTVVAVKAFKKGDVLSLATPATGTATATNDVCMVKLNVGPGNPGPAAAPSTSAGIGIEVWLPTTAAWNSRVHAIGGGGWQGGTAGSATAIASTSAAATAGTEGAVTSTTDTGHAVAGTGAFAMNPDGTINKTLWTDFAVRGIHEQAVKTKALAAAYYGAAPKWSYWEGGSTGGRQGLNLAQNNPTDFDGIIANYPAINWSRFITGELYPQIVYQRDLAGVPLTAAQQTLVSNAAISACDVVGTQHLGYILDPSACTYNPATDASVLCTAAGGTNATASCVTAAQATAMNKIWYGMTADGSVPVPTTDNGWTGASSTALMGSGLQRWFGLTRGTNTTSLAGPTTEFTISSDQVALELQDPRIAGTTFVNAVSNGLANWKGLTYAQLNNAYDQGVTLQPSFANINTDNPDLSAFKARGGKMLAWHGLADPLITPLGTINYYNRVSNAMGGLANVQSFYRLYLVPGAGHGSPNGTSNVNANPPAWGPTQEYDALTAWVEKGVAPDALTLSATSGTTTKTGLVCVYPKKATYSSGDINAATSYTCS